MARHLCIRIDVCVCTHAWVFVLVMGRCIFWCRAHRRDEAASQKEKILQQ
jgi:hypothetical protein